MLLRNESHGVALGNPGVVFLKENRVTYLKHGAVLIWVDPWITEKHLDRPQLLSNASKTHNALFTSKDGF
jgi:hypothetical protein